MTQPQERQRPRILDLFCGAGGAAMGYHRAGFEVVGVDIVDQPNYPLRFVRADALDVLEGKLSLLLPSEFDAVHASPPCQRYSVLRHAAETKGEDQPDLIEPTRDLLKQTGLPYVIENVEGAPLHNPIKLCGSGFGKGIQRHRLFECSFPALGVPCAHGQMPARFDVYEHGHWYKSPFVKVYGSGGGKAKEHWAEEMGVDWMTDAEMVEAIPPYYAEHVGSFLKAHLEAQVAA